MLYINFIIFFIFLLGYGISARKKEDWLKDIDKKEHSLYKLYPLSNGILTFFKINSALQKKEEIKAAMRALHIGKKAEQEQKLYWCGKVAFVIFIVLIFNFLSIISHISEKQNSALKKGDYLYRPKVGQDSKEVDLQVTIKQNNVEKEHKKDSGYIQDIRLRIEGQRYTKEELTEIFQKAVETLEKKVLGENKAFTYVTSDLNFMDKLPDTGIRIQWKPESYSLIQVNGRVLNEELREEGVITSVLAVLSYYDEEYLHSMTFRIMPRILSDEEKLCLTLKDKLSDELKKTETKEQLSLPKSIENYRLTWKEKGKNSGVQIFLLGGVAAAFAWNVKDRELERRIKKRKQQMLFDYPEIISKFNLFVNAGMTVKQAFSRIAIDYETRKPRYNNEKRFAYEEMLITVNEINLGVPESSAYEHFGRRAGLHPYMKFSSLISQNLKKGNKGISEQLQKEALEAFEERKQMAKRLGEEAGTKLLLPMGIMLMIVFAFILIPAFTAFPL